MKKLMLQIMGEIDFVREFHDKFDLALGDTDILSDDEALQKFRTNFLQEELDEFRVALASKDRVKAFDALLDLAYVTYGTALCLGIDPDQWCMGFDAVHEANMTKVRARWDSESKRGHASDVIKPEGFVGPEGKLRAILMRAYDNGTDQKA